MVKVVGKKEIKAKTQAPLTFERTQELRTFIYRLEYIEEERQRLRYREKEVFAAAKAAGFDAAALKKTFADHQAKMTARATPRTTSDIYASALETF